MQISAPFTGNNDDMTLLVAIDAARATRVEGVAGLQRTATLT